MNLLVNYNWPGNVRELENMVETMVLLSSDERLTVSDVPTNVLTDQALNEKTPAEGEMINLKKACHQFEHQFITRVMEKLRWNQTKAAKAMGIHRNTLIIKMERLEINSRR
jgi:transcriptional regulator with PAS, ATPase and Fis domain